MCSPLRQRRVDHRLAVDHVGSQPLRGGQVAVGDPLLVQGLGDQLTHLVVRAARPEVALHDAPGTAQGRVQALPERIGLHQVDHPDAPTRDLVDVGRTDAAARRPQLRLAPLALLELVEQHVVGHHQVRPLADEEVGAVEAGRRQAVELVHQRRRVDDHPVAEQVAGRG